MLRRSGITIIAILTLLATTGPAQARQTGTGSGYFVTIAARWCTGYDQIRANLARNNIQESLRDLGLDSPYKPGDLVLPSIEASTQPGCRPLPGWQFTLGTAIGSKPSVGIWGSLSNVSGAMAPWLPNVTPIVTQASVPNRDAHGVPIQNTSIEGATTVELTNAQKTLAQQSSRLWIQGGVPGDPVLDAVPGFIGGYAFGALRCSIDNLNGDNVEWIAYPTGREHVYCFAYYVTPPPGSATVTIRKRVSSPPNATKSFEFEGNISYTATHTFGLNVVKGNTPSATFYRAETRPGDPAWTFRENVPSGWLAPQIECTSQKGSTVVVSRATATVSILPLLAGDVVDCLFVNEQNVEDGTLVLSKRTIGRAGTFSMTIRPEGGGATRTAVSTTTRAGEVVDAVPSPIRLRPGRYTISEELPEATGGVWRLAAINCDASTQPGPGPVTVEITAQKGSACVFENVFVPEGSITIEKVTRGGVGTFGFLIAAQSTPVREYEQRATTSGEDEPVAAAGDSTRRLALGTYVIRETSTAPDAGGRWALESVVCDGQLEPFAQGKVTVELTAEHPDLTCRFVNEHLLLSALPDPRPTPTPTPDPVPVPVPLPSPAPEPVTDLVVSKRALVRSVRVGQRAAFEITVTNAGEATAERVVLVDQPRRGGQIATASASQGSCRERELLACRLGTLAPGASATVRVQVMATGGLVLRNVAVAGSATAENRLGNNRASARVAIVAAIGARDGCTAAGGRAGRGARAAAC